MPGRPNGRTGWVRAGGARAPAGEEARGHLPRRAQVRVLGRRAARAHRARSPSVRRGPRRRSGSSTSPTSSTRRSTPTGRSSARTPSRRARTRSSPTGPAAASSASTGRRGRISSGRRSRTAASACTTTTSASSATASRSGRRSRSSAETGIGEPRRTGGDVDVNEAARRDVRAAAGRGRRPARPVLPDPLDRALPAASRQRLGGARCSRRGSTSGATSRRSDPCSQTAARTRSPSSGIGPAYIGAAALIHERPRPEPRGLARRADAGVVRALGRAGLVLVRVLVAPPGRSRRRSSRSRRRSASWRSSSPPEPGTGRTSRGATSSRRSSRWRSSPSDSRPPGSTVAASGRRGSAARAARGDAQLRARCARARVGDRGCRTCGRCASRRGRSGCSRVSPPERCAFLVTTVAVYLATGKRELFFLYGEQPRSAVGKRRRCRGRGDSDAEPLARSREARPALRRAVLPLALLGLRLSWALWPDWNRSTRATQATIGSGACRSPSSSRRSFCLPLCVLAVAAIVVWAVRHRAAARDKLRAIRLLAELTIASAGIVVGLRGEHAHGLAASALRVRPRLPAPGAPRRDRGDRTRLGPASGGPTRRAGEAIASRPRSLFIVARRRRSRPSSSLVDGIRPHDGLPRLESRQLGVGQYTAELPRHAATCRLEATTPSGAAIIDPGGVDSDVRVRERRAAFTLYVERRRPRVSGHSRPCPDPRLVAAWPTVMGLPPGSFELGAVVGQERLGRAATNAYGRTLSLASVRR